MQQLNLRLTLNKNGSITANWASITGAVRYEAFMYPVGESYAIYNERNLKTTSYTSAAGLKANKQYKVTVSAYGSSAIIVSAAAQVLIPSDFYKNTPLTVPQNVRATADTVSVTVSYDAVERATGYDILFDNAVYNTGGTTRSFTGLQSNTSHTYAVRAKNATVTGAYSTTKTIRTLIQTPAIPSGIKKTVTETSATISWNAVSGATGYDIQFNGATYSLTGNSRTFTGLAAGRSYSFQIRSKNAGAVSAYTASMTVVTAPKPPSSVSATSTVDTVTISWNAVSGATGYIVSFSGNDFKQTDVHQTGTSGRFTGLKPNTLYTYQVCSKSADGSGSYSTAKTIKTLPKTPDAPGDAVAYTNENSLTVSWGAVSGATGYDVLFNGTVYGVTGTSKTFSGLTPDTGYTWQVRSKNADGIGVYGAAQTARTTPKAPAGASETTNENSVTVSWGAVSGATGYDILFNGTVYSVTGTSRTFTGLKPNTGYSYQIRVKNANGASSYSAAKTISTAPVPPTSSSATVSRDSVTISWGASSGATSYDVLFNGSVYRVTGTSKTITGLMPGASYSYQIRSNNADGSSSYSAVQTVTTTPNPPSVPTDVRATATINSVTVSWNAVSGATSYDVLLNGVTYQVTGTSKTVTGLNSDTTYRYQVRANNAGGSSLYSGAQTVQTPLAPPAVPVNVRAIIDKNTIMIMWSSVKGAKSYDVLFNGVVYEVKGYEFKTFINLSYNTNYTYAVRAKNSSGASAYSPTQTARTPIAPPAVPANVTATATANTVTVSWSVVTGATGYMVSFGGTVYQVTGTSKTFTGLQSDANYTYAVCAKNAGGSGDYSRAQIIHTLAVLPEMPTGIVINVTAHSVTINWNAAVRATGYDILFNGSIYTVSDTSIAFNALDAYADYTFQVCAVNEFGSSNYTALQTFRTLLETPFNVRARATMTTVTVTWNPVTGADSYDVRFDGEDYTVAGSTGRAAFRMKRKRGPHKMFFDLEPGTEHSFCVRASNAAGSGGYSALQTIKTKINNFNGLPGFGPNRNYPDGRLPYMGLDPVNALTGAFLWSYTFLEDYGKDALQFTLMYDSQRQDNRKALGRGWSHSLNYLLSIDSKNMYFSTPYDEVVPFYIYEDGSFQPVVQTKFCLQRKEQSYVVSAMDGTEYIFDSNLILSQIVENGLATCSFSSDAEGKIIRIEGRYGAALTLAWSGGHISRVSDALGNAVTYAYDGDLLISATGPDGSGMSFAYDAAGKLTEIMDFSGSCYLGNEYDEYGRVMSQSTAGRGESLVSYDEENKVTTFTDELGNETKYHYDEEMHHWQKSGTYPWHGGDYRRCPQSH